MQWGYKQNVRHRLKKLYRHAEFENESFKLGSLFMVIISGKYLHFEVYRSFKNSFLYKLYKI